MKQSKENWEKLLEVVPDMTDEQVSILLEKMKERSKPFPADDYLTISEVGKLLKIGRTTVWRLSKIGLLKPCRIGGRVLYARSCIDNIFRKEASNGTN